MNCKIGKHAAWFAAAVFVFGIASTASAQVFTGRVDVTVEDSTGEIGRASCRERV